jgi:hypothetical protein
MQMQADRSSPEGYQVSRLLKSHASPVFFPPLFVLSSIDDKVSVDTKATTAGFEFKISSVDLPTSEQL